MRQPDFGARHPLALIVIMPARTRVKFCGIRHLSDALLAVELGVDAVGFVFYPNSPRFIEPVVARQIIAALPPMLTTVGLFVDADSARVAKITADTGIDLVQYHGVEAGLTCAASPRPYIKAIAVDPNTDFEWVAKEYAGARALLLDAYHPQLRGGTGRQFDWSLVPRNSAKPFILAGGLTAENVATAISTVRPYAVDVSGGIESSKGVKDPQKMREFMAEVIRIERDSESR
jgi:phosphoribosylanthranilate isomerase